MSSFAKRLTERVEDYITLRRSLGYSFQKQASILRALVRYVEAEQIGGPLTQEIALHFVLSWDGTANGRVVRYGVARCFAAYLAIYDPLTEAFDPKPDEPEPISLLYAPARRVSSGEVWHEPVSDGALRRSDRWGAVVL
jgi:hypothetical protein